ncbi:hypothetical protein [Caulobacter sp. NIBR2454]|uniref:hypothetical protein n=1 Tax=Caulobacter sp. NIBR2454 TaxID=3015996 RepID=UPI0022B61179|nr:hypothetical protein [Caulobacter sp. NIBR2454]
MRSTTPNAAWRSHASAQRRPVSDDLFLPLGTPFRMGIVIYLVLYHLLFPIIGTGLNGAWGALAVPRVLAETLLVFLTALPFLFVRRDAGWLSPLFLPTIFLVAKEVFKNPLALVAPFQSPMVYMGVETASRADSLRLSAFDLDATRLGLTLLYCLGLAVYYAAYFTWRRVPMPRIPFGPGRRVGAVCVGVIALSTLVALWLFEQSGGISRYLVAMRGGRVILFSDIGPVLQVISFSALIITIWQAYERRPFANPWFLAGVFLALAGTLLATGSRSGAIVPALAIVLLWWRQLGRVAFIPALCALLAAYAVLGGFGAVRQSYGSQTVDWSVLNPSRAGEWLTSTVAEAARRDNEESDLAAFAAANEKGLLLGKTYAYALAAWIPRAAWPDKPRAADSYNMWIAYEGHAMDDPLPRAGQRALFGIPVSSPVEAYWNFHIFGVVLVSMLMGFFHRFVVTFVKAYRAVPIVFPMVIYFSVQFTGTAKDLVNVTRDVGMLIPLLMLMGVLTLQYTHSARRGATVT